MGLNDSPQSVSEPVARDLGSTGFLKKESLDCSLGLAVPNLDEKGSRSLSQEQHGVYQVSLTTRRHDMFLLTEKNYPLSNGVMTLMLSAKLQVEEDSDIARDLVMKIFMTANKPKSRTLEIIKLKKRVKKLEKKKKSGSSGLKRLRKRRIDQDVSAAATKVVSAAEPTVFDDEEVTMTMAQIVIKMTTEKAKILDEQIAKRLHDKEVEKAAAREKQEKDDLERAKVLQQQYDDKEENIDWNADAEQIQEKHLDNIRKYQSLERKPVSIAQARKNMIMYLKNMARYKMKHFKGMNYDKVRPIFEREYKKVQTLFKPNKDVEEPIKKRVTKETRL
uniref:Uncharacterized protein n=1 Tax=Tanacetum cinerariifolium TaxID=118510 RepID=A0A6L2LUK3_TANCI|nr:hypothetical protein [Tanacetum cinerariifolium]